MNEINVIRRELRALGITRRCRCYGRIVMAIQLAVDQEDSLEAVHLTETEALEMARGGAEHPHCGADRVADQPGTAAGDGGVSPGRAAHRIGIFGDPVQRCAAGDGEKRGGSVFNSRNMTEKGGESRPVHCTGERKTV